MSGDSEEVSWCTPYVVPHLFVWVFFLLCLHGEIDFFAEGLASVPSRDGQGIGNETLSQAILGACRGSLKSYLRFCYGVTKATVDGTVLRAG